MIIDDLAFFRMIVHTESKPARCPSSFGSVPGQVYCMWVR